MADSQSQVTKDAQDGIRHVVLLLMENRSFDQMVGCFQQTYPDLDGIDPNAPPRTNRDREGNEFKQLPTESQQMPVDPRHETKPHVLAQLEDNNSGFVRDFADFYGGKAGPDDRQLIMSYYPPMFLPALHRMARDFTICDHWFSSVPGPTWPNRFFAFSGTASGRVEMPSLKNPDLDNLIFRQHQTTLFDRLNEAGKSWKVYFYDFASSLILTHQRELHNLLNYHKIDRFFQDVAHLKPNEFPEFVLIEPKYAGLDQNDDHPPHNIMKGEKLIADVYNAIRSNEDLWNETLLVIVFDEHGGFYDHVSPPPAVPPDEHQEEYTFDRLGVRVPAVLVSPWVGKKLEKTEFDHTSLLKYLTNKWSLGSLGARTAAANSIGVAITETQPRQNTLSFVRISTSVVLPPRPDLEKEVDSDHHIALRAFANYLRTEMGVEPAKLLEVAAEPGLLMKSKARIGNVFLHWGTALTRDLDDNDQQKIKMAVDTVIAFLKRS